MAEAPDLVHVLYREVVVREASAEYRGPVERESLRRQPDGSWRLLADGIRFLRASGGTAWVIGEEFADLWDDEDDEARAQVVGEPGR